MPPQLIPIESQLPRPKPLLYYPEIIDAYYGKPGPRWDAEHAEEQKATQENPQFEQGDILLTAHVLTKTTESLGPHFEKEAGFTVGYCWGVRIEDMHFRDCSDIRPNNYHYCLEFGESSDEEDTLNEYTLTVAYCDNHPDSGGEIEQDPGKIVVRARSASSKITAASIATTAAKAYIEGMHRFFPEYGTIFGPFQAN